jgi:hypothetical protein
MLVMVFKCINPSPTKTPPPQTHVKDESLFGTHAFSEEVNESLLKFELFCFNKLLFHKMIWKIFWLSGRNMSANTHVWAFWHDKLLEFQEVI